MKMDMTTRLKEIKDRQAEADKLHLVTCKCEVHGVEYTMDTRITENQCPICKAENEAKKQSELLETKRYQRIIATGLPARFVEKTFDQYHTNTPLQEEIVSMVREYAQNDDSLSMGRCLMLFGGVGTGKTHLAASVINEFIKTENKRTAIYTTARDMIRCIRASWGNRDIDEGAVIDRYASADLLVIDEVGVQFGSEAESILMFEIIDKRYGNRLPTAFLSNLSLGEIKQVLGDRVIDRMREDDGLAIEMRWDSKRGKM